LEVTIMGIRLNHLGKIAPAAVMTGLCLALAACSSPASGGNPSEHGAATANAAAAAAVLAPYTGKAGAFPIDQPLTKRPAAGTTFAYLQCSTPICAMFVPQLRAATKALGAKLTVTLGGSSADQLQNAMNSIVAEKPAAVILPGIEADTINVQLRELHSMGIPVFSNGIIGSSKYGIEAGFNDSPTMQVVGRLQAAWAVKQHSGTTNAVFYTIPELSFSSVEEQSFNTEMKALCAACTVRSVDLPVSTIGNSAPSRVVSDLQAHPSTNVAVFATEEAATGLPAALRAAGLSGTVQVTGYGPTPGNLQDIKSGGLAGGLVVDTAVINWSLIDEAARAATRQPLTSWERAGIPPLQFVAAADLHGDLSSGFFVYPDYAQRFGQLWSGEKR
jgi:ribose transport system substrate-binding protein